MAMQTFTQAYEFTLIDEKGKDDDPLDRGGRTCDGITQDEFDAWCHLHNSLSGDVWNITDGTRKAIYYANYWHPWCDALPVPIDYLFFDMDVNSGGREAALILQRCLKFQGRMLDGRMGIVTISMAVKAAQINVHNLIDAICTEHERVYNLIIDAHPTDERFKKGWDNRIAHERANALRLLEPAV